MIYKLAGLGWHLFPIVPGGKAPLTHNGFKDATTNPTQLEEWTEQYPGCNWAVATGPSQLLVLDLDRSKDVYNPHQIEHLLEHQSITPTVRTPSGGIHIYFTRPAHCLTTQINALFPAVDVRANSGYVLCPPSVNYEWLINPFETIIADPPIRLLEALNRPFKGPSLPQGEELFLKAGMGRWEHCRRIAGSLRRLGCTADTVYKSLQAFTENQCEPDESINNFKLKLLADWAAALPGLEEDPLAKYHKIKIPCLDDQDSSTVIIKTPGGDYFRIPKTELAAAIKDGAIIVKVDL